MKAVSPSFIGTTAATVLAAIYTCTVKNVSPLWTPMFESFLLGGPVIVLIAYTITSFYFEQTRTPTGIGSYLGRGEYPMRIIAQMFLGLALAALSEDVVYYIICFMIFVTFNTLITITTRGISKHLLATDLSNFVISAFFTWIALTLCFFARSTEADFAAFLTDPTAFNVRVTHVRGEKSDSLFLLALSVGAMLINIGQILLWPIWRQRHAEKPAPQRPTTTTPTVRKRTTRAPVAKGGPTEGPTA